jgi:uncharacterized RDD family membrane protein YckC
MTSEPKGQPNSSGGGPNRQPEITLARWSTRFWAWLVDFIIVTAAFEILFAIAYAPLAFMQGIDGSMPAWLGGARYAIQSLMFFAYWTYFESSTGQSLGKKLLKIKTTDRVGKVADVKSVAIQSFGKSFLLPLDVLLGWIFTNDTRQRLLSRAANTIVIKFEETSSSSNGGVRYIKG